MSYIGRNLKKIHDDHKKKKDSQFSPICADYNDCYEHGECNPPHPTLFCKITWDGGDHNTEMYLWVYKLEDLAWVFDDTDVSVELIKPDVMTDAGQWIKDNAILNGFILEKGSHGSHDSPIQFVSLKKLTEPARPS